MVADDERHSGPGYSGPTVSTVVAVMSGMYRGGAGLELGRFRDHDEAQFLVPPAGQAHAAGDHRGSRAGR